MLISPSLDQIYYLASRWVETNARPPPPPGASIHPECQNCPQHKVPIIQIEALQETKWMEQVSGFSAYETHVDPTGLDSLGNGANVIDSPHRQLCAVTWNC